MFNELRLHNRLRTELSDYRLSESFHYKSEFPLPHFTTLKEWEKRKSELKERILISSGLSPLPVKCALNPRIYDRVDYGTFTVEKVIFESLPGFHVTGNLYKPKLNNQTKRIPAILNPHGHWEEGRLVRSEQCDVPIRCANLAMMGCIAFSYDMIGFLDSKQLSRAAFGTEEELWGLSLFGLQLWNSIRSLDFLLTLPETDPDKIGCLGESGGGTQTFVLTAVDDRVKVACPVNMISAHMQGGCLCENAPALRIGLTSNVEIAALIAPRPMLMTGCTGDWTHNVPNKEFPAIKAIYELYNEGDKLGLFYDDDSHNFNRSTRVAVYRWIQRILLQTEEGWEEQAFICENIDSLRLFPLDDPRDTQSYAIEFFEQWKTEKKALQPHKHNLQSTMEHVMGISSVSNDSYQTLTPEELYIEHLAVKETESLDITTLLSGFNNNALQHPITIVRSKKVTPNGSVIMCFAEAGVRSFQADDCWKKRLDEWLLMGYSLAFADLFLTGDYIQPYAHTGRNTFGSSFFTTYNYTDHAYRVQDIVQISRYMANNASFSDVSLFGLGDAGLWSLAALPFLHHVSSVALDLNGFDLSLSASDELYLKRFHVPHYRAIGGFFSSLRLAAPRSITLFHLDPEQDRESIVQLNGQKEWSLYDQFPEKWNWS